MQKTSFVFIVSFFLSGLSMLQAQSDDCSRLLQEAAVFEKDKQYDRALKKYLSAKEECDAATSAGVNLKILAVFEKIEQQRKEAVEATRQADANAKRARNAELKTIQEKKKAERSSEANRLAALAVSKAKTNPTLGLHLVAMAREMALDSSGKNCTEPGVASSLHSISSDAKAWLYRPLKGHSGPVNDVTFSPDGQIVASCGNDLTIRLWNLKGEPLDTLFGHRKAPQKIKFSSDGKYILSLQRDSVYLWDSNGRLKHILDLKIKTLPDSNTVIPAQNYTLTPKPYYPSTNPVPLQYTYTPPPITTPKYKPVPVSYQSDNSMATFSPNNKYILTANAGETAIIWNVETGDTVKVLSSAYLGKGIHSAQYSPDGSLILLRNYDSYVLIDTNGQLKDTIWGKTIRIRQADFSPDGQYIVIDRDNAIFFKDISTGRLDSIIVGYHNTQLCLNKKSKLIAFYDSDYGSVKVVDYFFRPFFTKYTIPVNQYIKEMDFVWYDQYLLCSSDAYISFINISQGSITNLDAHKGGFGMAISPDSRYAASVGWDGRVLVWYKSMAPLLSSSSQPSKRFQVYSSPDGKCILAGEPGAKIKLYDADLKLVKELETASTMTRSDAIHFVPARERFIINCPDSVIRIWDYKGRLVKAIKDTTLYIYNAQISPKGDRIIGNSANGTIRIWDVSGNVINTIINEISADRNYYFTIQYAQDGSFFYIRTDSSMQIRDKDGALLTHWKSNFDYVNLSQSGYFISTSYSPQTMLKVWDTKGFLLTEIATYSTQYKVSPSGRYLAVSKNDESIVIWDFISKAQRQFAVPSTISRIAFGQEDHLYVSTYTNDNNFITYKFDVKGNDMGRFSGTISLNMDKGFLPGDKLICYKTKGNKTDYFQILDKDHRIVQVLEGLPNLGGHDISQDGRYKLAWSTTDKNKIIVWGDDGYPLRTITTATDNVMRAYFSPDGRYIIVKSSAGDEIWENPENIVEKSKILSITDLIRGGVGVNTDSVLRSNDPEVLTEVADYYFYDRNDSDNAEKYYERLESVKHTPRALLQLYDIARQTGKKFDMKRFYKWEDAEEIAGYASFLQGRKQWADARALYEKAFSLKADASFLFQINMIADSLGQSFDMKAFDMFADKPQDLMAAATRYYYAQKWQQARYLYEASEGKQHDVEIMLQLQRISDQPGQEPLDFNRLLNNENAFDLEQYGYYFYNAQKWLKAESLFEKTEKIRHSYYNLVYLQVIADSLNKAFDFEQFKQIKDPAELNSYADFFYNRKQWSKAQALYTKSAEVKPEEDGSIFMRRIDLAYKNNNYSASDYALKQSGREFLQAASLQARTFAGDTSRGLKEILFFIDIARQIEDKWLSFDTASHTRREIASGYEAIAWANLFTRRESHAKVTEIAAKRGLEFIPDEKNDTGKYLKTDVAAALLLQGKFDEAWRDWYDPYKDKEYFGGQLSKFRDGFLSDIISLEKAGIKHPDFEKIKERLKIATDK